MEEISKTALAYYANLPEKQRRLAVDLYKSIDKDGDGKISLEEYENYFKQKKGFKTISSPKFFNLLDKNGDGSLNFDEFITVHYLCLSERIYYCDECKVFLDGVFFSCVQCFNGTGNTYDICCSCYRDKNLNHHKDAVFLDNYTLLQAKRQQASSSTQQQKEVLETIRQAKYGIITTSVAVSICEQM